MIKATRKIIKTKKIPLSGRKKVPKKIKKYVSKKINQMKETNYLYYSSALLPDTTAFAPRLMNGCIQGDALGSRTGNQINVTGINIQFGMYYSYVDATHVYGAYDDLIGIWIVCDTQSNGAIFTDADFGGDGITCSAVVRKDWDNRKRFRTIYHTIVNYRAPQQTAAMPGSGCVLSQRFWTKNFKFKKPIRTFYNGNAGTIADITKNSIYLFAASFNTNIANYFAPKLFYSYRTYFNE